MVWIKTMAGTVKDVYLASNLTELQDRAKVKSIDNSNARNLLNSSQKILEAAEKQVLLGDEELAYVYFFRFVEAVTTVQKKEDYKKDKVFLEKLIPKTKVVKALDTLEKIGDSLQKRYALKKEIQSIDSAAKDKEFNDALENANLHKKNLSTNGKPLSAGDNIKSISSLNGIVKTNGEDTKAPLLPSGGITTTELKNLLEMKAKRILIVDCRDQADFSKNHINHSNCICIPATVLSPGMSAETILNKLKECSPESYMDWNKRDTFDHIILYDWNSTFDNQLTGLKTIYVALTKWDPNRKHVDVQVIQGGMKKLYYSYPNMLTNPQTAAVNTANKFDESVPPSKENKKLDSIVFPDWEDKPKVQKPPNSAPGKINLSNASVPNLPTSDGWNHLPSPTEEHDVPKPSGLKFDRSTKPTGYSSNHKILNGCDVATRGENRSVEISSNLEKTDAKMKEYFHALEDVIESSNNAIRSEQEFKDLREKLYKEHDKNLESMLNTKEEQLEGLKKVLEKSVEEVSKLKGQYEALLREHKSTLPRIRVPPEEAEITSKEELMERLNQQVKEMRKMRIQQETEKREELRKQADKESNSSSTLPPLANNKAVGPSVKLNNGVGITKLPAINSSITPGSGITPSSTTNVNPSLNVQPSNSRPISQDASGITRQKLKDEGFEPPRSSSLKRSHSHPNIAQSHDEDMVDDLPASSQPPRVNRGLKPSHRAPEVTTPRRFARNFEVVSSTERSKTGLKNLGNTCYMNSIIQCLSHTNKLVDFLRNEEYMKEWHPSRSPTKGEATEELAAAVKQMHSGHRSISLLDLKSTVGKHHRSFRGYEQQDSHEFITILLDWLHEEMNRAPEKTPLKEQKNDGLTDDVAACRAWEDYKKSNNSKISELFCGQQKSCVTCGSCSRQSVTFEPFFILSVPIPSSGKRCDIQQCIDFYTTEEELQGWNCVHCKKKVRATKKIDLWRMPPYLIIHLQRFYFDGYWKKRLTEIDFPVENLNLNNKVLKKPDPVSERIPSNDYRLYGVSNHYGSMDGGHYTAYCRLLGPSAGWCKFDDQEVCHINSRDVPTAAAYILFYQNRSY